MALCGAPLGAPLERGMPLEREASDAVWRCPQDTLAALALQQSLAALASHCALSAVGSRGAVPRRRAGAATRRLGAAASATDPAPALDFAQATYLSRIAFGFCAAAIGSALQGRWGSPEVSGGGVTGGTHTILECAIRARGGFLDQNPGPAEPWTSRGKNPALRAGPSGKAPKKERCVSQIQPRNPDCE